MVIWKYPNVYLDDFHVRTVSIVRLRTRFIQLAYELIHMGDTTRANRVLDRCIELTPDSKIPYDHTIIQVASAYYQCNQFDKANALVKTLSEKCNNRLTYLLDQKESFLSSVNDQIVYNFQILQNLQMSTKNYNQTALSAALDSITTRQYGIYTKKVK